MTLADPTGACAGFEDQAALLAGGDLSAIEAAPVLEHVAGCAACAQVLAETRKVLVRARRLETPAFREGELDGMNARVLATVDRRARRRRRSARLASTLLGGAACASSLFLSVRGPAEGPRPAVVTAPLAPQEIHEPAAPEPAADEALWAAGWQEDPPEPSHQLKIELRTRDPKIRIVWLAQR